MRLCAVRWMAIWTLAAPPALAGAPVHRDVEVSVEGGKIVTGLVDLDTPGNPVVTGVRVFSGAFGEAPNLTDDPGFNAKGNTTQSPAPFAPGTLMAFDIVDALREWDGNDFDLIADETLTIFLGFNPDITTPPMADGVVSGFNFVAAGSTGGFHQHFNYFLDAPAQDGVYRLALRLRASGGAVASSDPFYIVLRQGNSASLIEAQEDAIQYMNNLLSPAPCPGDADGNGVVDFSDITSVLGAWLASYGEGQTGPGDANRDGVVDFNDISNVLANWGGTCP